MICYKGKWAIFMYHPSVEKEGDRMKWFQNHNILIRPYRVKECYENPREVLKDFFQWLIDNP
ncbi:hypothetical protein [Thermoactinomyces sp. CICC 10523]|uniref:hypothetical protein n=1 Tax=Thermoactinomyces sp. CICC 10523 TaxID=2767428 RepID=UPI0018DAF6DC|nr:hypothetical protein [Thermoactinomyces sp. CICC 10523]MBH8597474.1 hypothetical protein [Thermoactinomyces sp. CICC 10523]